MIFCFSVKTISWYQNGNVTINTPSYQRCNHPFTKQLSLFIHSTPCTVILASLFQPDYTHIGDGISTEYVVHNHLPTLALTRPPHAHAPLRCARFFKTSGGSSFTFLLGFFKRPGTPNLALTHSICTTDSVRTSVETMNNSKAARP
jgi:hypothetical protein